MQKKLSPFCITIVVVRHSDDVCGQKKIAKWTLASRGAADSEMDKSRQQASLQETIELLMVDSWYRVEQKKNHMHKPRRGRYEAKLFF